MPLPGRRAHLADGRRPVPRERVVGPLLGRGAYLAAFLLVPPDTPLLGDRAGCQRLLEDLREIAVAFRRAHGLPPEVEGVVPPHVPLLEIIRGVTDAEKVALGRAFERQGVDRLDTGGRSLKVGRTAENVAHTAWDILSRHAGDGTAPAPPPPRDIFQSASHPYRAAGHAGSCLVVALLDPDGLDATRTAAECLRGSLVPRWTGPWREVFGSMPDVSALARATGVRLIPTPGTR